MMPMVPASQGLLYVLSAITAATCDAAVAA